MQFMLKWEVDFELGGDRAPLTCDVRLGAAFDDQPTACFLGRSEPGHCLEEKCSGAKRTLMPYTGEYQLF